jgi:hypothetical protein
MIAQQFPQSTKGAGMNLPLTVTRAGRALGLAVLVMLVIAGSAFAQISTGTVVGKVVDTQGNPLPGVTVTLTGAGAPQVYVTDAEGNFRYPSLAPGRYTVKAELAGMGTASSAADVNIGRTSTINMTLNPTVSQTITVTAETPLLDVRKTGTGATVTKVELEEVPTARDPWVVLQQVPGVLTDRINVGGNESGQQSSFVGKGAGGDQATFNVDGVNITDMSALGSSPAYYDFDSFEEIQVATGGSDPRIQTPGVQLNMVYKRGTNDIRGSARYFQTPGKESTVDEEARPYLNAFNAIDEVTDYGLELGGPIMKDRLWLWGAYGKNQIDLFVAQPTTNQLPIDPVTGERIGAGVRYTDQTKLETLNGKLNAQVTSNNSAVLLYTDSSKVKFGRNASPTRPPNTTYNQDNYGPKGSYKIEDTHIFGPSFYLTGMYSKTNGGFQLVPNSGKNCTSFECINGSDVHNAILDVNTLAWANTFAYAFIKRPQQQYRADGSTFFETGSLNHELKFGAGLREVKQQTQSGWPGLQWFGDYTNVGAPNCCGLSLQRPASSDTQAKYTDLYVGDTMLFGNLTVQAGLRYDQQKGHSNPLSTTANPDAPDLLPAATLNVPDEIEWTSISPRIGATYTFGSSRRTVLRGGYNRYVDQLGTGTISAVNPLSLYQYLYFYGVNDANGDGHISGAELANSPDAYIYATYGLDPNDPTHTKQLIRFDDDMNPPHTDEFVAGFEHELMSDFTVGMTYTHRKLDDILTTRYEKTQGAGDWYSSADYELAGNAVGNLPPCAVDPATGKVPRGSNGIGCEGSAFSVPVYVLKAGIATPTYGVITNRPDYGQTYDGLELTGVKRMSHHWMMRGNISWNDWRQQVGPDAFADPTPLRTTYGCSNCDDGLVVQGSGTGSGAKGGVYINSRWSYNLTSVVQLPWQFNVGASVTGREGYPIPYVARVNTGPNTAGGEGFKQVLVTDDIDAFRLPDVFNLDLRLAKDFRFNRAGLTLSVDAFNVTNERTILQRTTRLNDRLNRTFTSAARIVEAQSPRVFRFGARLTF